MVLLAEMVCYSTNGFVLWYKWCLLNREASPDFTPRTLFQTPLAAAASPVLRGRVRPRRLCICIFRLPLAAL